MTTELEQQQASHTVQIWTDGACLGNPGAGGWGALLRYRDKEAQLSGAEAQSTNNRMELMACIQALSALKRPSKVRLTTDSVYVRDGVSKWLAAWKRNNWKTASKKPVKNQDLWEQLDQACLPHHIEWLWVKGHSGQSENELCDQLARKEAVAIKAQALPTDAQEQAQAQAALSVQDKDATTVQEPLMLGNYQIVKLNAQSDFEQWAQLYQGYASFYNVPTLSQEHLERVWSWLCNEQGPMYGLCVLDAQNKMLGLAHLRAFMRPLAGEWGLYLDDLFVSPAVRGARLGEALILEAAKRAKQNGQGRIRWITDANNAQARKLYDRIALKTNWVTYDYLV